MSYNVANYNKYTIFNTKSQTMPDTLSLYTLNSKIRNLIKEGMPERYWVSAEVSEARTNYSGHCYLELIDKDELSNEIRAKARAAIWASTYRNIRAYFKKSTGSEIVPGIKILIQVSVDMHELYGYSLTVHDIDPRYTLGDMARQRAEIIRRLTEEGIIDMNRGLTWVALPQRIAVISSPTAAGYGDFIDQLHNNPYGYRFYTSLYCAAMQGSQAESSIVGALERIYNHKNAYDSVVIIRGGGATSDLNCFDSYLLAQNVANFPLPIIVGIGHDRDETVLDRVANVRVKTPTATAEWLIATMNEADSYLQQLQENIQRHIETRLQYERARLESTTKHLPLLIERRIAGEKSRIAYLSPLLRQHITHKMEQYHRQLALLEQGVQLSSPEHILMRGFSITLKDGKAVRSVQELKSGDRISTFYSDGCSESQIL